MWGSLRQREKSCKWKKKIFFLTSGVHSFEKEKYGIYISVHITTSGPFKSFNQIKLPLTEWAHFVGQSQACLWMGCFVEPGSPGQWWARYCQWCHYWVTASKSWCFWSEASSKKQATTENIMKPIRGLAEIAHTQLSDC